MKRIHLFEVEDFRWFPRALRKCLTPYIQTMHRLFGSKPNVSNLVIKGLNYSSELQILDLCSGSGGPMPGATFRINQAKRLISTDCN